MLFYFEKWFKYESLLNETKVCAVARDNDSFVDMLEYANELGKVKVLPTKAVEVSSTEIREKLKNGESITGLVPADVESYIKERGLYV